MEQNEIFQKQINDLSIEKLALDQLYVECLKANLNLKKEILLLQQSLNKEIEEKNKIKEKLGKQALQEEASPMESIL